MQPKRLMDTKFQQQDHHALMKLEPPGGREIRSVSNKQSDERIDRKVGRPSLYDAEATCWFTVLEAGPNVVTHVKTIEKDGYNAIQLGYGNAAKRTRPQRPLGTKKRNHPQVEDL